MIEFFNMGGHGFYIWTSYIVVVLVLGTSYYLSARKRRKLVKNLTIFYKGHSGQ